MTKAPLPLAVAACAELSACAPEPAAPAATTMVARPAPVVVQDGRYRGVGQLSSQSPQRCGARNPITMTVRRGSATVLAGSGFSFRTATPVAADGSLSMATTGSRSATLTGRFAERRFNGELRAGECAWSLDLTWRAYVP